MKRIVMISVIAIALLSFATAGAQNIVIGERVPEIKADTWLADRQPTDDAQLTYIEFFHSPSKSCRESLVNLKEISNKLGTKLRIIIVTQENSDKISALLEPYASGNMFVAFDKAGRNFSEFGVSYVPFGVLTEVKNRALWMGNSRKITAEMIEQISKQK